MSLLEKLKTLIAGESSRESGSGNPSSGPAGSTATPNTSSEQAVKEPTEQASPPGSHSPSIDDAEAVETADETPDTAATPTESESDESDEAETRDSAGQGTAVSEISGIGPAYSDRLESIGVETVEQLASAEPDDIAGQTDISIGRVSNWIERAQDF